MQKFANFITRHASYRWILEDSADFQELLMIMRIEVEPAEEAPVVADKGDKGDDGEDGGLLDTLLI